MLAAAIAQFYRGTKSAGSWRLACPAHGGEDPNLSIRDADDGGLLVTCHSHGCSYQEIVAAFVNDGAMGKQEWRYPDGRTVTRWNNRDGSKTIRQTTNANAGSSAGSPVLLAGPADAPVVVVEGEKAFDAVRSIEGLAAATWRGGAKGVRKADFTQLANRNVLLWPDHDDESHAAMQSAAERIHHVGAATIAILPAVGEPGGKQDAADLRPADVQAHIDAGGAPWFPVTTEPTVFAYKNAAALEGALTALQYRVRLNERSARVELLPAGEAEWIEMDDQREARLRETIGDQFFYVGARGPLPLRFGRDTWRDGINAICDTNRVDPFAEWLGALPSWDGEERLPWMLSQVFGAPLDDLSKWASRTTLVGAVVRCRRPGAPLDEIPVLLGPQGIGKSKLWPALFPARHRDDWFSDTLDFGGRLREQVESTLGRVIVEAGELAGLAGSEIERLKTYISRTNDGTVRLAYAYRPRAIQRRFTIVGTTNQSHCLPNDESGNRRFVVIHCPRNALQAPVERWAETNREQLWAEAVALADAGDTARLPFALHRQRDERNEGHRSANETVESAVAKIEPLISDTGRTMLELIEALDGTSMARLTLERAHPREMARALRLAGWRNVTRRRGGRRGRNTRVWLSPDNDD